MKILQRQERPSFVVEYGIANSDDFYRYIDYYDDIGNWLHTRVTLVTENGEFPVDSELLKSLHSTVMQHEQEIPYN